MKSATRFTALFLALAALLSCAAKRAEYASAPRSASTEEKLRTAADMTASGAMPTAPSVAAKSAEESDVSVRQAPGAAALPAARMVIKTATVSVKVKDVDASYARAVQMVEQAGGFVQSSSLSTEYGKRAVVALRVPPQGFLPLLASLESLGQSMQKDISGQDVTEEYFDLKAQLENEQEVRARLLDLLKKAGTVKDAIQVEAELERVGGVVNRILGRMKYLETMVGMSTVSLTLYEEASYSPIRETFLNWSEVGHGFWQAAQVLVQGFFVLLQSLVVILPLGALVTAVVLAIRGLVRRRKGRKTRKPYPPAPEK